MALLAPELPPTPETTLVVVLGASTYPRKPVWTNHVLGASAQAVRDYVISPAGLAVPEHNVLDLFDDAAPAVKQCEIVEAFLRGDAASSARDLIVYYVGHGGFDAEEYYLAVRDTANDREFLTAIESPKLARIILESFGPRRVYVILDSCFAAHAASDWQGGSELVLAVKRMSRPLPRRGTAFLAAASKDEVALAPKSRTYTMFTGALLQSLQHGIPAGPERISLYELYERIRDTLNEQSYADASRPELHAPRQNEGDVSLLPMFPNAWYRRGLIGEVIKDFKITGRLGKGGMGEVWVAEQQIVKTKVAIKVLLADASSDRQLVQRFFNEAVAVGQIKHAGIAKIHDVGFHNRSAYLIMEFLDGETLGARIRRAGRLPLAQVGDVGRQIASVLEATHAAGITHRDLKPDNIFLVEDVELASRERVKILDFGIAKLGTATGLTRAGGAMGTPGYMAPEQWADAAKVDGRADVYALGCIAFEMCCGRPPFVASSIPEAYAKHAHEMPPRIRTLVGDVPRELDDVIAAALAKQPAGRPSMKDLREVFAAIASAHPAVPASTPQAVGHVVAPPRPSVEPDTTLGRAASSLTAPRRPRPWRLIAIGGSAIVALGAAGYTIVQPRGDPAPPPGPSPSDPITRRGALDAGHEDSPRPPSLAEALAQSNPFLLVGDLHVQAHQVTRREYAAYLDTLPAAGRTGATPLEEWDGTRGDDPVGWTRFEQATDLCAAISARLPTLQEWQRASGGSWGLDPTDTDHRGPLREWTAERTDDFIRVAGATATMTERQRADALNDGMSLFASEGGVATSAPSEVASTSVSDKEVGIRCVQ